MSKLHRIVKSQEYTRGYQIRYIAEIEHLGLKKFRVLKDTDYSFLLNKIYSQFSIWDEQWERNEIKRKKDENRENNSSVAIERTLEAQKELQALENILFDTLEIDDTINWDVLKDKSKFNEKNPKLYVKEEIKNLLKPEKILAASKPPRPNALLFQPKLNIFDKFLTSQKNKKIELANINYNEALKSWEIQCEKIDLINKKIDDDFEKEMIVYNSDIEKINLKYEKLEEKWKNHEVAFYDEQNINNQKIDKLKELYFSKDEQAILHYCEMVLNNSIYPEYFPKDFELDFNSESGIIIVDYFLPSLDVMPTLKEVKYISTRNELKEAYITELQKSKIFDEVIYKIVLRTIHELFEADRADALKSIVFNGWVNSINKANGKLLNSCIVSIKVDKKEFLEIDLSQIEVKACFKSLKGIGSSKLSSLVAIQPIIQIDKTDKRFVSSYDVAEGVEGENLALMSWEDFEHLVRELFEKEFSVNGGEVKVTQSSRDGGVDAIAFDPDPIRGGKIVIQAKRYTNTVGLSAVRDLYGTVMNEGATKGILVTTADYGPDAYTFAQNKPITLLNGANLLYLLEKHGHKSRIDIKEAKQVNKN